MRRVMAGEAVVTRQVAMLRERDEGVRAEAIFFAALLLTCPRLLPLDPAGSAPRYAVALEGGPAVVEFDAEGFPGPEMAIRAPANLKGEAIRLLDELETTLASLRPVPAATAPVEDAEDLPF